MRAVPMSADARATWWEFSRTDYRSSLQLSGSPDIMAKVAEVEAGLAEAAETDLFLTIADQDRPVGALWLERPCLPGSTHWWLNDIIIFPEHRHRGYGRRALRLAEDLIRDAGGDTVGLTVFDHNHIAKQLYASEGYRPVEIELTKHLRTAGPSER